MKIGNMIENLDWNHPDAIRNESISQLTDTKELWRLIQPCNPECNKNVWDGCARVLAQKSDTELAPYMIPLLEWLQDPNWPGFAIVLKRLEEMEPALAARPYAYCVMRAIEQDDGLWLDTLSRFCERKEFYAILSKEEKQIIMRHYQKRLERQEVR